MDMKEIDKKKNMRGSTISAIVVLVFSALYVSLFLWLGSLDENPLPKAVCVLFIAVYVAVIVGVLVALKQRHKEIKKGEIYEAREHKNY